MQAVGMVQDVKHELQTPVTADFYLPHAQDVWSSMVLVARTTVDPLSLANQMRQQVWTLDKDQPVFDVQTMEEVRSFSVSLYSFSAGSLGIFAAIALRWGYRSRRMSTPCCSARRRWNSHGAGGRARTF